MTIVFIPPSYFRCCYWRLFFTCGSKHCKFNVWTFIAETQRHYLQIRWRPNFGQCPLDWYGATAVCIWRNWRNLAHLKLLAWAMFVHTSNFLHLLWNNILFSTLTTLRHLRTNENFSHNNLSSLRKNVMLVDYVRAPAVRIIIVTMRDWNGENIARGSQ